MLEKIVKEYVLVIIEDVLNLYSVKGDVLFILFIRRGLVISK